MIPVEFPKWVKPADSHIIKSQDGTVLSTPHFPEFHIDRITGELSVLVHSAEEEAKALAAMVSPKDPSGLKTDGPTVAEFVAAGYSAKHYPPSGYASKSGQDEVDAAIKAEDQAEQAKKKADDAAAAAAEAKQKADADAEAKRKAAAVASTAKP